MRGALFCRVVLCCGGQISARAFFRFKPSAAAAAKNDDSDEYDYPTTVLVPEERIEASHLCILLPSIYYEGKGNTVTPLYVLLCVFHTSIHSPGTLTALCMVSIMPIMATVSSCCALISPVRKKSHISTMKLGK